jgi:hypothetical protein
MFSTHERFHERATTMLTPDVPVPILLRWLSLMIIMGVEPQYLNQPPRSRPPSRLLFTSTTAHHHTSATQLLDMLQTSSARSRVQHLANAPFKNITHHTRKNKEQT